CLILSLAVGALPAVLADDTPAVPQSAYPWLSECSEDLTGETITLYHFGDLSGAYAFITQPIIAGLEDSITLMNGNGGICGATVAQEFRDTGGDTEQSQAFWDEFSAREDAYMIYLYASADGELLLKQAEEAGIVLLNAAGSELALYGEEGQPSVQYTALPLYVDQLGAFCDYVGENWASMGMEGDPVIGHLSWEGAFGRSSDTDATRAYCEAAGVGYAGAEYFLPTTSDIAPQLQTLVGNGANIIYTTSLASGPAQIAGTVAALELNVLVSGVNWALDTSVIGLGGEATNGITGNLPFLWWDEIAEPGVQKVVNYWLENRMAVDPEAAVRVRNIAYITSFGILDLWAEAMIQTINRVGYANLSGEALDETFSALQYDAFDGLLPVDFTDGKRSGSSTRIGQIQFVESDSGVTPSVVPLTDWFTVPDLKVGGADVPQ
ncbi:MAG TPA: ABC transporter substrate-binding protein, partial [Aggregatilineales bacterium]|nr:ABC transporter substrate-binding protein [Aggregatilineales bacterium]